MASPFSLNVTQTTRGFELGLVFNVPLRICHTTSLPEIHAHLLLQITCSRLLLHMWAEKELSPTCLEFPLPLFSATLREKVCFPAMSAAWRVMLLWVCIGLPVQVRGALVFSSRDTLTEVKCLFVIGHKFDCLLNVCVQN